jgi:hypothetical protein
MDLCISSAMFFRCCEVPRVDLMELLGRCFDWNFCGLAELKEERDLCFGIDGFDGDLIGLIGICW